MAIAGGEVLSRRSEPDPLPGPSRRFDIDRALTRIEQAIGAYRPAAMFELAERGYRSVFEQLVACLISIRTRDEVTIPASLSLFAIARTPTEVAALTPDRIDGLIAACTFHAPKARQIHAIARAAVDDFGAELPCDFEALTSLRGVGPKCAGLVLGIACGQQRIAVDIHVHRVTNRWGYVSASTPEKTLVALEAMLPRRWWIDINRLLVPFGKHVCTGTAPRCSSCPVVDMCRRVGVTRHR